MLTKKELKKLSEITEVKIIWQGLNRKRSRIASVIVDKDIGITIRSKREIYFCAIFPGSPKWLPEFSKEDAEKDFEYYGRCILNGVVDNTIDPPHLKGNSYNSISDNSCAFS